MSRFDLDEATFRALAAKAPFYAIAARFDVDTRTVAALAARYGVASAFVAKGATAAEEAEIRARSAEGWSIKRIATALGRSQDFVARRIHGLSAPEDLALTGRPPRGAWPRPTTTAAQALRGRSYDDVPAAVLAREWPPRRGAVNGAALATAGRLSAHSTSRSTADLCADF